MILVLLISNNQKRFKILGFLGTSGPLKTFKLTCHH